MRILPFDKGDEKGLCHVSYTSMQRALRYISNLSLMGYCQVGRKYWKYFSGTIPVMGTEEIANRVYLNIYWIHKGDKERVDQVISKLNSEIIITTQNQMERLRLICKNDALLNAFVLTHMTTDVLYENKDTKLRELMESFEKNTRPSQNFNGKGTGVSSKRFNARSKEFLFGQQPDKVRPLSPNKAFPLSSNVTPSLKEVVMKILGFIASPRKGSNTDTLVDETLKGSDVAGHTYEKLQLYNYEISACIDCRKCKKGDFVCVVKDSMQEIYPKMDEADLIIFGMPNYWYGPTAKMKLLIDRMRPYIANGKLKGKKVVVVTPAAEGPDACGPLIEMFGMSFRQLDMEFTGKILATAYERGEIKSNQESLKSAYDLGASLQTSYAVVEKEGSGLNIGHLC